MQDKPTRTLTLSYELSSYLHSIFSSLVKSCHGPRSFVVKLSNSFPKVGLLTGAGSNSGTSAVVLDATVTENCRLITVLATAWDNLCKLAILEIVLQKKKDWRMPGVHLLAMVDSGRQKRGRIGAMTSRAGFISLPLELSQWT